MVKTPKTRHSKSRREPVTIDLDPADVSRVTEVDGAAGDQARGEEATSPSEPAGAESEAGAHAIRSDTPAEAPESAAEQPKGFDYDFAEEPARPQPEPAATARADAGQADSSRPDSQPVQTKRGGIGFLAAGLIGGAIALVGAGGLQFAGLLGAPGSSGASAGDIAALKNEIAGLKSNADGDVVARLSAALDQVKTDVAALKAAPQAGDGADGKIAALSDRIAQLETALAAADKNPAAPVDLGPVNEKLDALDGKIKSADQAAGTLDGRVVALEQLASQLSGKVDAQASQPKIALAIAASALKAALDRGAPFTAELDTFAAVRPDAPQIAVLRPYAEKGLPTRVDLAATMSDAANAMIAAATPVDPNQSVFQRLMSSAESLVKVRPIGAVEGKGAPETVARLEVAVTQGDYAKALSEYDTLPEPAKAAGADFAGKLKARLDAEAAVDALVSGAMKG